MAKPSTGPGRTTRSSQQTSTKSLGSRPQGIPTSAKSPARQTFERLSARPLLTLHGLPRFLPIVLFAALVVAGLLVPGAWAGIFLVIVGLVMVWLVALSWPVIESSAKVIRVLLAIVIFAAAIWRFTGNG